MEHSHFGSEGNALPHVREPYSFLAISQYEICPSREPFAYNETRHDSYPQFPRSPLRTPGTRAFHKLLEISQKVSRNFSKSCFL